MRRVHKLFAVAASGLLLTLALTPTALAAGTFSASSGTTGGSALSGTYTGKTSQGASVKISVSGTTVNKMKWGWKAHCKNGKILTSATKLTNAPISGGQFGATGSYKIFLNNGTYKAKVTVSLAGKINSTKSTGNFKIGAKVYKASSGKFVTGCTTGVQSWHAKKQ